MRDAPAPPVSDAQALQLSLLEKPAQLPDDELGPVAAAEGRRGRPPGSANRRTEDWARYLAGRYGHPLERLAQLYAADTKELARHLGLKVGEVLRLQIEAEKAVLPYVASPMPQKVQVSGKGALAFGVVPLGLNMPSGDRLVDVDALTALDQLARGIIPAEMQEFQQVSDVEPEAGNATDGNAEGESHAPPTG